MSLSSRTVGIIRWMPKALALVSAGCLTAAEIAPEPTTGKPFIQQVEADFDGLFSSDIQLSQTTLTYGQKRDRIDLNVSVAYSTYDFDYQPASFDFLGAATEVDQRRIAGQIGGRGQVLESLALLVSGGLYDGYTEYRSAWLNEYYRQQFSDLKGFGEEYRTPSPRGENINVGLRWEYLPTVGFIQADVSYSHDEIAPGYEIGFEGLRSSRANLYTAAYHLAFENILTRRIRVLNEFRISDTSIREQRYGYQGSINIALGERWSVRAFGGYTEEAPTFRAYYFGGTLEFEPSDGWLLSLSGRNYHDTGQIENALFSSASPGLDSWQAGLGIRRVWGIHSFKLVVSPYFTRYEPAGIGTAFFQGLYRNRDWFSVQMAYAAEF